MANIEVEHRGLLSAKKFNELKKFFNANGKFIGTKKRFSMINNTSDKTVREVKDDPIDLKLRITNKKPELAIKYGKWSGKDARKEFNFFLEEDKYDDMLEFLQIMGFNKFVIMVNTKYDYGYRGIEFSLVEVPEWGYYFEAEISTKQGMEKEAEKKIDREIAALGLKVLNEEEFYDLLDDLNNRDGFRIDLRKISFKNIQNKFSDYF